MGDGVAAANGRALSAEPVDLFGPRLLNLLLWVYVATSPFYIVASLQVGDVLCLLVCSSMLVQPGSWRLILRFVSGAYAWIGGALTAVTLIVPLFDSTPLHDLLTWAELCFIIWMLIPLVALSIARSSSPIATLERISWIFVVWYAVAVLTYFGLHREWLLYRTPIGRLFSPFVYLSLQQIAISVAAVQLSRGRRPGRYVLLLVLASVPFMLAVQRTGIVTVALLALAAALANLRSVRGMAILVVAVAGIGAVLASTEVQGSLAVKVLKSGALFEDAERQHAIRSTIDHLRQRPSALAWGLGWGKSGDSEIPAHNLAIQLSAEIGVPAALLMCCFLAIPVFRAVGRRLVDSTEFRLTLALLATVWVAWMLNAFPVERVHWLAFAVASGLGFRCAHPELAPREARAPRAAVAAPGSIDTLPARP